ncbi:hypothetical protein ACQ4N7_28380 [Nodosilinea sp. AN01ver1]|uniref:hypothetical protein n=1 Tax=Nodosilinea sp. AN01ver1 TaxID=3423362 RepID=UPI003D310938
MAHFYTNRCHTPGVVGDFNFLHNTTGYTLVTAIEKAQANPGNVAMSFIDTCGRNSLNIGFTLYYDNRSVIPATDRLGLFIARGVSGAAFRNLQSANGALAGTGPFLIIVNFDGANTPTVRINGGAVGLPNNFGSFGTPSSANHTFPMTEGKIASGSSEYFHGKKAFTAFMAQQTLTKIQEIEAHWMALLGIG